MVAKTAGERWDHRHKPVPSSNGQYCDAILPSGTRCGRSLNFVRNPYGTLGTGTGFDERGNEGYWRHNPRPYQNY